LIAEQAPWQRLARFGLGWLPIPPSWPRPLGLKFKLLGVPLRFGCWPTSAHGDGRPPAVTLTEWPKILDLPCDTGVRLRPCAQHRTTLLIGCALREGVVQVDDWQETTVPGVYCAWRDQQALAAWNGHFVGGEIAGFGGHGTARGGAAFGLPAP